VQLEVLGQGRQHLKLLAALETKVLIHHQRGIMVESVVMVSLTAQRVEVERELLEVAQSLEISEELVELA
jgi:hypothetical protein